MARWSWSIRGQSAMAGRGHAPSPLLPSGGRPAPVRSCGRRPCRFCLGVGKVIFNRQPVTFVAAGCASDLLSGAIEPC